MADRIRRRSLQSEIIEYIQNYIKENELKVGDQLPSQDRLIRMMGVSRTSLREAMKTLEARGILYAHNGKGFFVSEEIGTTFSLLIHFTKEKETLLETLDVRKILEKEILRMVIQRASDSEIKELGVIADELTDRIKKGEPQTEIDKKFHYTIYRLSHNEVMYQLILSLNYALEQFWRFPLNMSDPFADSLPFHGMLYEAICERDIKKAQCINTQLLDAVYRDISSQR